MKSARSTSFAFLGRVSLVCAVLAVSFLLPTVADAAPLIVRGTQFPVAAEPDPIGGFAPAGFPDLVDVPFEGFGFTGKLTSRIRQGTSSNPNGLTFTYLLKSDPPHPITNNHVIHRFTVRGFDDGLPTSVIATDVSYQSTSAGVIPTLVDRSTEGVIGFSFVDPIPGVPYTQGNIPPGGQSRLLVIETNATTVFLGGTSFASIINGTVAHALTYAPMGFFPEPSTFVLAALGLITLLGFIRRSNRRRGPGH